MPTIIYEVLTEMEPSGSLVCHLSEFKEFAISIKMKRIGSSDILST